METTDPLTLAPFPTGIQCLTYRTIPAAFLAAPPFPKSTSWGLHIRYPSNRHLKDGYNHSFRPFRYPLHVLCPPKRRPKPPTLHGRNPQRPRFLFRLHSRHPCLLPFPQKTRPTPPTFYTQLKKLRILLNTSKCVFCVREILFLGYKISSLGSQALSQRVTELQALPLPRTSANSDVSWECSISNGVFSRMQPPPKHLLTTYSLVPKSRDRTLSPDWLTPRSLPRMQNQLVSSRSPGSSRLVYYTRASYERFNNRHGCRPSTTGTRRIASLCLLFTEAEPVAANVQHVQSGTISLLRGREILPPHPGGRHFNVLTDHKLLTFDLHPKRDKCSPR